MPVAISVGVQWGDEGKGKIVDYLTENVDLVVRFQGGNNAGHTVVADGRKTALQLIPSGILRTGTRCLLASGVVVNPWSIIEELKGLSDVGIEVTPERLGLAGEVQLILPYHQAIDAGREKIRAEGKLGTTGKGIGPSYEHLVTRSGIRLADLQKSSVLKEQLENNVDQANRYLREVLASDQKFDSKQVFSELEKLGEQLLPHLTNVSAEVHRAIGRGQFVMFEGAQGSLLDVSHGTYPYVTSSHTLSGFACASAGVGPKVVDLVLGICKAYCTRVGGGPFPTEDFGEDGDKLRNVGAEFGTVTGRPRRCGWFDAMAVKRAIRLNGIDHLIITKLDVLTGLNPIKIGRSYKLNGEQLEDLPPHWKDIESIEVDYDEFPGWSEDITQVSSFEALPENAKNLLRHIEKEVDCPVGGFSVGPDRKQTIIMSDAVAAFASRPT